MGKPAKTSNQAEGKSQSAPGELAELVTGAEIGRRLGVTRERVRQWASDPRYGFPKSLGRIGHAVVWRWSEVEGWSRRRRASKEDGRGKPPTPAP